MEQPILTKSEFYRRWNEGILGNRPHTWKNVQNCLESGYQGGVSIRYSGRNSGGRAIHNITPTELPKTVASLIRDGWRESDMHFYEHVGGATFNGEVIEDPYIGGLVLYFSTVKGLMRDSLREGGRQVSGMSAIAILQSRLWGEDYLRLRDLVDRYPGHTIEFSEFDRFVGIEKGSRMIIWEVRKY